MSNDTLLVQQPINKLNQFIFFLLLLIIGITPLIIMTGRVEVISPVISHLHHLSSGDKFELFTHYKAFFMLLMTGIISILFIIKIVFMNERFQKTLLNYVILLLLLAITISTLLSPNVTIAMYGQSNRHDGAISWICYLILLFVAMNSQFPKNFARYIAFALYPFIILNFVIILLNFTGFDLYQFKWFQNYLFWFWPIEYYVDEGSIILGTLNQWNFMSGMFSIMTVLFLSLTLMESTRKVRTMHFIITIMSTVVLLLSTSTSGFITVMCLLVLLTVYCWKSPNRNRNYLIVSAFVLVSLTFSYALSFQNERIWKESFGMFTIEDLSRVFVGNETVVIGKGETIEFQLPELPEPGVSAGSGRIYIWKKTIELVAERPLVGYGLDTILYNFPHFNLEARAGLGNEYTLVDKPHNTFLAVLYGTGIFGFISYLIIVMFLCVIIYRSLMKEFNQVLLPFAFSSLAFFIQGIFNDSTPEIATTSWVLVGITFGLYFRAREQKIMQLT